MSELRVLIEIIFSLMMQRQKIIFAKQGVSCWRFHFLEFWNYLF